MAVKAGTDTACVFKDEYLDLTQSVREGLLPERLDTALVRLFTARMRLGMFDPPEQVAFSKHPPQRQPFAGEPAAGVAGRAGIDRVAQERRPAAAGDARSQARRRGTQRHLSDRPGGQLQGHADRAGPPHRRHGGALRRRASDLRPGRAVRRHRRHPRSPQRLRRRPARGVLQRNAVFGPGRGYAHRSPDRFRLERGVPRAGRRSQRLLGPLERNDHPAGAGRLQLRGRRPTLRP